LELLKSMKEMYSTSAKLLAWIGNSTSFFLATPPWLSELAGDPRRDHQIISPSRMVEGSEKRWCAPPHQLIPQLEEIPPSGLSMERPWVLRKFRAVEDRCL
jgi:hypothetical protein